MSGVTAEKPTSCSYFCHYLDSGILTLPTTDPAPEVIHHAIADVLKTLSLQKQNT